MLLALFIALLELIGSSVAGQRPCQLDVRVQRLIGHQEHTIEVSRCFDQAGFEYLRVVNNQELEAEKEVYIPHKNWDKTIVTMIDIINSPDKKANYAPARTRSWSYRVQFQGKEYLADQGNPKQRRAFEFISGTLTELGQKVSSPSRE